MRLFIAMAVPEPIRAGVREWQQRLRRLVSGPALRWANPDQMHLTLAFLGEVDEPRLPHLNATVEAACSSSAPFLISVRGAGFFPNEHRPRVVWVGVCSPHGELERLQRSVRGAMKDYAEKREGRAFRPHLTLARASCLSSAEAGVIGGAVRAAQSACWGEWTADAVLVMRSELLPQGSRHTCLARIPLVNSPGCGSGLRQAGHRLAAGPGSTGTAHLQPGGGISVPGG
jgi:RNA 2',3'-cyclic 3'-phosphodiesterase